MATRLAPCVPRPETRQRRQAYVDGLLSGAERKNGWQLAEVNGEVTPYGMQHLLGRAVWSEAAAREARYAYLTDPLGDPAGIIVLDDTGFRKKGIGDP